MKRSTFIRNTAASTAYITMGGLSVCCTEPEPVKISILHTNDVHSHILPFGPNQGKRSMKGGIARRSTLIQKLRDENPNTLLFDAGDIFQGTPYFNYFAGELEFKLMSMLKYDAATIGNHDFDNGIEGLHAQLPNAKFDFISANYDFTNTLMQGLVKPYKTFLVSGVKIGVFGLGIELEGLVSANSFKETKYLDPIEIAKDITRTLKTDNACDLVICLSHLGYSYENPKKVSDLKLAKYTENIDLIIGGHTHTFLNEPSEVINSAGKKVLVNQVGCYGLFLGKVDFYFNTLSNSVISQLLSI